MENIIFISKKAMLLMFIFFLTILLTYVYVTSTGNISNEIKKEKIGWENDTDLIEEKESPSIIKKDNNGKDKTGIECFYDDTQNVLLELNESEPILGNAIFFHESSCPEDINDIKLSFRQACSIESALIAQPENEVFLLISSPARVQASETKNVFVRELLSYPNFNIRHINFERYLSNTPLRKLYDSGALNKSNWPTSHASDILRYTTLYKFGGIYLDLDVIVLKSLSNLTDYTGAESNVSIAAGIINFSSSPIGKEMAVECAEELSRTFDGKQWGNNGPGVIKRVLIKKCGTTEIPAMNESKCKGFHVYPVSYFYPIYYTDFKIVFEKGKTELVKSLISNSYALHVWNKFSAALDLNAPDIPYMKLAEIYCPKTFRVNKN